MLPESFDRLLSISAHPTLSRYVRTICYIPVQCVSCSSVLDFQGCCFDSLITREGNDRKGIDYPEDLYLPTSGWQAHHNSNQTYYRLEQELFESSTIDDVLCHALANLPKLDKFIMVNHVTLISTDDGQTFCTHLCGKCSNRFCLRRVRSSWVCRHKSP